MLWYFLKDEQNSKFGKLTSPNYVKFLPLCFAYRVGFVDFYRIRAPPHDTSFGENIVLWKKSQEIMESRQSMWSSPATK